MIKEIPRAGWVYEDKLPGEGGIGRDAFGLVNDHPVHYRGHEKRNISRCGCFRRNNFPSLPLLWAISRASALSPCGQK